MNKWPHIAGIVFSVIFGFTFMFSKILIQHITPIGVIAYRFLAAFIVFELLRVFKIIKLEINLKNSLPIIIVALFQPVIYNIFEAYGLARTASAEAGLMIALKPIFVVIFGAFILKEKPKILQVFFIILSFAGVIVIQISKLNGDLQTDIIGFIFLLIAVIAGAFFNIASRNASKKYKPAEITYMMTLVGMISFNGIYLVQLASDNQVGQYVTNLMNFKVVFPILYLGIMASIIGFFLVNYSLSRLPAHVSAIYINITTIVSVLAGYFFLNESIGIYHLIGGVMIIVGVYGTARVNYLKKIKGLKRTV